MGTITHGWTTAKPDDPSYDVSAGELAGAHVIPTDAVVKNNFSATTDPTVNDDSGDGYEIGSRWINTSTDTLFTCLSASVGAAAWSSSGGAALLPLDIPPASPHADDDEFDTADTDPIAGWTTLGSPTVLDANTTNRGHLYLKPTTSGLRSWEGIYKAAPSMPFTVSAKLSGMLTRESFHTAALFIAESPPGLIEGIGLRCQATLSVAGVYVITMSSPTGAAGVPLVAANTWTQGPIWLRGVVASATDVTWYFSLNGISWSSLFVSRNPGFTPGVVGLGGMSEEAAFDTEAHWDWIRFT